MKKRKKVSAEITIDDPKTQARKIHERIKKLHNIVTRAESGESNISITALRSIEFLCSIEGKIQPFALFLVQSMLHRQSAEIKPDALPIILNAIEAMQDRLGGGAAMPVREGYWKCRKFQNETQRLSNGIVVRIVKSDHLLLVEYALECFFQPVNPKAGYMVARQYVERWDSRYSIGIIPPSLPFLKDVVEYWTKTFGSSSVNPAL